MVPVLTPTKNVNRPHVRGLLLSTLRKETLLVGLGVARDGRLAVEAMEWDSYWSPLHDLGSQEAEVALEALHSAWREHIRSGFSPDLRQEFCFRYFSLLDVLLNKLGEPASFRSWSGALQAVLGFESFGITWATANSEVLAAGTCTLRNPSYLLAKLKTPNALDDPQFLPLITVAAGGKPELFYHYRQYNLAAHSKMLLLVYPAVSEVKRSESFVLIHSLISGVSDAIDPRTQERAQRLYDAVFRTIIQAIKHPESSSVTLEFVDVGAGSGSLTASLCRQIQKLGPSLGFSPKIRLWFVDLELADPTRFFRSAAARRLVDTFIFLGNDYRGWLNKPLPLPTSNGLRIALVSKLFDNLSRLSVQCISPKELFRGRDNAMTAPDLDLCSPALCLAPGGRGVEALQISNSRMVLRAGRTFSQISLSEFYRGLSLVSSPQTSVEGQDRGIFLPIRAFNPESLATLDGRSVIARLIEHSDYLLIEDPDLTPNDLVAHMRRFSLNSITVRNLTKVIGLTGNFAYLLWSKMKEEPGDSLGEKLW